MLNDNFFLSYKWHDVYIEVCSVERWRLVYSLLLNKNNRKLTNIVHNSFDNITFNTL